MFLELKTSKSESKRRMNSDVAFEPWNSGNWRSSRRKSKASATLAERVCAAMFTFILWRSHSMWCLLSLLPALRPSACWRRWSLTMKSQLTIPLGDIRTFCDAKLLRTDFKMWAGSSKTWTRAWAFEGWGKNGFMSSGSSLAPSSLIIERWAAGPSAMKQMGWEPVSWIFWREILTRLARSGPLRPVKQTVTKIRSKLSRRSAT